MALKAHDTGRFQEIGIVPRSMDIVAIEARDSARVHDAGHEVIALHAILVRGAIGKMRESTLAELVVFELPEILEIQPHLETDRPIVVFPFDRVI